jgi:hypothetical protein
MKISFELTIEEVTLVDLTVGQIRSLEEELHGVGSVATLPGRNGAKYVVEIEADDVWDAALLYAELRETVAALLGTSRGWSMPERPTILEEEA